jgi:hypothetical protein
MVVGPRHVVCFQVHVEINTLLPSPLCASHVRRPVYFATVLGGGSAHLIWQLATLRVHDARDCAAKFVSNKWFGAIVFAAIVADRLAASSAESTESGSTLTLAEPQSAVSIKSTSRGPTAPAPVKEIRAL